MRETDDIERLFRESFEGFEITPPTSVKTGIDKELKSKRSLVWWLSACIVVLATIASTLVFLNRSASEKSEAEKDLFTKNNSAESSSGSKEYASNIYHSLPSGTSHSDKQQTVFKTGKKHPLTDQKVQQKTFATRSPKSTSSNPESLKHHLSSKKKAVKTILKKQHERRGSNGKNTTKKNTTSKNAEQTAETIKTGSETLDATTQTGMIESSATITDSISTAEADSSSAQDSLAITSSVENPNPEKGTSGNNEKLWMASLYLGPQFDLWKVSKPDFDLNIHPSIRTSIEISRQLKSNFGISAGLGYNQFKESGQTSYVSGIDTVTTVDSIPIYDQQNPDSIIGYQTVVNYQYDTIKGHSAYSNSTTAFYVPFFISKTFELSDKWTIMTDLGATFNFYTTKTQNPSNPNSPVKSYNSFGINAALRLYGGYRFNPNWMVTAGLTYSIYLKTPVVYNGLSTQRMFISPQLGIHYTF